MENKLFDVLVAAIADGTDTIINLKEILLDELYCLDDEISEADAEKFVDNFIAEKFVEAEDVASRLNAETIAFLNERELAARGW